ncbi:MAG: S26 family signal peptidase, partial [Planctomycetota bacterium]
MEATVLEALAKAPISAGKIVERLQAEGDPRFSGRAALVYGALSNLRSRGAVKVVSEGPGEAIWGVPDAPLVPPRPPGFPPSFSLDAGHLAFLEAEVAWLSRGSPQHVFEELRRVVVADADRRVFRGVAVERAVREALADLGPRGAVRKMLRQVARGRPVALRLKRSYARLWGSALAFLAIVVGIRFFVVGIYRVPTASMAPALLPDVEGGDARVLVNFLAYLGHPPARGDIVVFRLPGTDGTL